MRKALLLLSAALVLLFLHGCSSTPIETTPVDFLEMLDEAVAQDSKKAVSQYAGKEFQFTMVVDWVQAEKGLANATADHTVASVELSDQEFEKMEYGKVITVEGTIGSFEEYGNKTRITVSPAKTVQERYRVSGEVQGIYISQKYGRYFAIENHDILSSCDQVNIFLPEKILEQYKAGDTITAEGALSLSENSMGSIILPTTGMDAVILNMLDAKVSP